MNSTITIRLVPIPHKTTGSGTHVRIDYGMSAAQLECALRPVIEPQVKRKYGGDVQLIFEEGRVPDIRLTGIFPVKAGIVKEEVGLILGEAFDHLDPSSFSGD